MDPNNTNIPNTSNEEYDPNLEAQDEDVLSGGNNRLAYILLGVIIALVIGYIALPKGAGTGISSVTPSFMLSDAAVTASAPAAEDSAAAKATAKVAPTATATKTITAAKPITTTTTTTIAAAAPVTTAVAPAPEVAPAPTPAPVAAPEPAAPTTTMLAGKIEDENGRPLAGATVFLKGTNKIASTDASGSYSIEVPASGDNVLTYGYGGYDDEIVTARGGKAVNVTLTPRAKASRKRR